MRRDVLEHEGKAFHIVHRKYEEYHGITAAIITMNEGDNIVEFINHIRPLVKRIVLIDGGSVDDTVKLAEPLVDTLITIPFKGHFGEQKNEAIKLCYTDWVLFLDPDERLDDNVYKIIPKLIEQDDYDCYVFPRREIRDGIEDKKVYPDYQYRLFRTYCRYVRPVHEELVGYKKEKKLDEGRGFDIIHDKVEDRHNTRNTSYEYFQMHYRHECGSPGKQLEDTIEKINIPEVENV